MDIEGIKSELDPLSIIYLKKEIDDSDIRYQFDKLSNNSINDSKNGLFEGNMHNKYNPDLEHIGMKNNDQKIVWIPFHIKSEDVHGDCNESANIAIGDMLEDAIDLKNIKLENAEHEVKHETSVGDEINGFSDSSSDFIMRTTTEDSDTSTEIVDRRGTTEKSHPLTKRVESTRRAAKNKKHACHLCAFKTHRKKNLKMHQLTVHLKDAGNEYACKLCSYKTYCYRYLKSHTFRMHEAGAAKIHTCDHCDYKSNFRHNLRLHIVTVHNKNSVKKHGCDLCSYKTHLLRNLKRHKVLIHEGGDVKKYICDFCDYKARHKSRLNEHIQALHNKKAIKKHACDKCDYRTYYKSYLTKHKIVLHDKNLKKSHGCKLCDYNTNHHYNLMQHIKAVHNEVQENSCDF